MLSTLTICLEMYSSKGIHNEGATGSQEVYKLLQDRNGQFFNFQPKYPWEGLPLGSNGDIFGNAGLFHSALHRSVDATKQQVGGDGTFSYIASQKDFELRQRCDASQQDVVNSVAKQQVLFVKEFAPDFCPALSAVDAFGENVPIAQSHIKKRTLQRLHWFQLFGPGYCETHGRDVFLKTPAWKTEDWGDLGVAVTLTDRFTDWLNNPPKPPVEYFSGLFPGIKPYRARIS
jgi:hypothetical protein